MNKFIFKHRKVIFSLAIIVPILVVFLVLIVSSSNQDQKLQKLQAKFSDWNEKTGTVTPFKATFPGPTESKLDTITLKDGNAKQEILSFQDSTSGDSYIVQAVVYPVEIESNDKDTQSQYLQGLLDDIVSRVQGEVVTKRIGDIYGQMREASFVIYQPSEELYYKGKILVRGNTLYQIWTSTKSKEQTEQDEYFINSFKVAE